MDEDVLGEFFREIITPAVSIDVYPETKSYELLIFLH